MSQQKTKSPDRSTGLPTYRRWKLPEPCDAALVSRLCEETGLAEEAASVLLRRNRGELRRAREMIADTEPIVFDPISLPAMKTAADRVLKASELREQVAVYSDFDADGVTSAAILKEALEALGLAPVVYIPSRMTEGYGFHSDRVSSLAEQGVSLIITADCGITAYSACENALGLGVDVIVTDHHLPGNGPLPALAVIDPHLESWTGEDRDYRILSGAGVAYLLAMAFLGEASRRGIRGAKRVPPDWAHDLLTLSIAGDGQPLSGLNRAWVQSGLLSLAKSERTGLRALQIVAEAHRHSDDLRPLSFDRDVTFGLVPRINAAGRLADARLALDLLCEDDDETAMKMAEQLDKLNSDRRSIEEVILNECRDGALEEDYAVCAHGPDWHEGVIGIVCSKLREAYYRPVALMAGDGEFAKGSARGIPGFHVYNALQVCKDLLQDYGGHEGAAGFSISQDNIDRFGHRFRTVCEEMLSESTVEKALELDETLDFTRVSDTTLRSILALEPFGHDTPLPRLASFDCGIEHVRFMGKTSAHLELLLSKGGEVKRFIWFGRGDAAKTIALMGDCDVAFVPYRSTYLGREELLPLIRDIRPAWGTSGLQYESLARSIPRDRPVILYTWSQTASVSLCVALEKAGRRAVLHGPESRGALSHDANLALRSPGGVVVSTSPWTLLRTTGERQVDDAVILVVHSPLIQDDFVSLAGLSEGREVYLWSKWQDDGGLWLTWTYPEKEDMENLWNYTKKLFNGSRLSLVDVGKAWRGYLEALGLQKDAALYQDGARTLLSSLIRIVEEIGLGRWQDGAKVPELRVQQSWAKKSLSESQWYAKGASTREGARGLAERFSIDNYRLWRDAL